MGWVCVCVPLFFVRNALHLVVLIAIVFVRQLIFKVSYALWFSSSIAFMTWLVILWVSVISLLIKREPLETTDHLIMSSLLFGLNPVTKCHNLSLSIFHVQPQASIYRLN